jgi:DNA-binding SARP family transcriptional activator
MFNHSRNAIGTCDASISMIIHLLRGPYVSVHEERLDVPEGSKRLLVLAAITGGPVDRRHAAGILWPNGDDLRAAGNLRSALWRLRSAGLDVLAADKCALSLRAGISVDIDLLYAWAERVLDPGVPTCELSGLELCGEALNLLPGWYDDWVLFERERLRQRLLHALEALSRRFATAGRHADAVEAALTAVHAEPLRESAQKALIRAHLAEGNLGEARRAYRQYRLTVVRELGVAPGEELAALVGEHGPLVGERGPSAMHVPLPRSPRRRADLSVAEGPTARAPGREPLR